MPTSTIAVTTGVGPRIRLHSGGWLDLLSPETSEFTIEDIAHGLAHTCRYAGQADGFYSVAEHSLLVSAVAVGHEYTGLMHDAAEAFIGDVTRPLKQLLPEYRRIEARMEEAIFARFDVAPASAAIKSADLRVLAAEQAQIMPEGTDSWADDAGVEPAQVQVSRLAPEEAKRQFLARYEELRPAGSAATG